MDVRFDERPNLRAAYIRPLEKGRGRVVVSQTRMYDPRHMGGLGDWSKPLIEWAGERAATLEEAEHMADAFQEAVRIGREWESKKQNTNGIH